MEYGKKFAMYFDGGLFVNQQLAEHVKLKNQDDLSVEAKERSEYRLQGCSTSKLEVGANTTVYINMLDMEGKIIPSKIGDLEIDGLCMIGGAKITNVHVGRLGHLFIIDDFRCKTEIDTLDIDGSVHRINTACAQTILLRPGGRMFIGHYWHTDVQPNNVHLNKSRTWYVEMHDTVMHTKEPGWAFG